MAQRFVAPLTDEELEVLTAAYHHGEKRALRRRAHAILLSHQGYTINQIRDILQVTRDTISIWFKNWETAGLSTLVDKPRCGRPSILDAQDVDRLQDLVQQHPHQLRTLQARLQEDTGKRFSAATLRRALKKTDTASNVSDIP
ncbi:hypothetical protein GCM10007160_25690 [Litchfieldella qijiaojingensis]|uniref:Helix-turn-helix domain-containing protein n=2 Tax=Litchfieldella qijiaojingensis TaxID=980347 RepID=A0ABQ2YYS8_9GAMM|nr:hypothetical protein GCM10007160_25690 [Halomonas qijiaojingensis]